ncbi:hypothetical protein AA313_de0204726 [Arthrobotrys entomopaga]|nr:hypothetical protein AA313_de0204726 [Arthrobotrys entomopaga]
MEFTVGSFQVKDTANVNLAGAGSNILDLNLLTSFSNQVIASKNLQLNLKSSPQIALGPLKYGVNIEKSLQLKGLDRLQGITVSGATLLDQTSPDGTNMVANCVIPNPSSFTIQIGNLTADITIGPMKLGTTTLRDLTLQPGNNEVKIFTQLNPLLLAARPVVSMVLATPNLDISLTFTSVVFDGQRVSWLEKPLNDLSPFTARLNAQSGSSGPTGPDIANGIINTLTGLLGGGQSNPVQNNPVQTTPGQTTPGQTAPVQNGTPQPNTSPQNEVGKVINGFLGGISKLLPLSFP